MKAIDYGKAAGLAVGLFAANLVVSVLAMLVYTTIHPGLDGAEQQAVAQRVVPWVVGFAAPVFFFLAGFVSARGRPERNGAAYALAFCVVYLLLDGLFAVAANAVTPAMWLHMAGHFVAAQVGALLGRRNSKTAA